MALPLATPEELRTLVDAAQSGAAASGPANLHSMYLRIKALPKGDLKTREMEKFRGLLEASKRERSQAMRAAAQGGASREQQKQLAQSVMKAPPAEPRQTVLGGVLNALDETFSEPIRRAVTEAARIPGEAYESSESFHPAVEAAARNGSAAAGLFEGAKSATPGFVLGTVAGAFPQLRPYKGAIQLGGAIASVFADQHLADSEGWRKVKRLGADLTFDLSNLIGAAAPVASAANEAERLLVAAGKSAPEAKQIAGEAIKSTLGSEGGLLPDAFKRLSEQLATHGVPHAETAGAFGSKGQYLGSSKIELGAGPLKFQVPGYQVQKAIDAPVEGLRKLQAGEGKLAAAANKLPDAAAIASPYERIAERRGMKALARQAKAQTEQLRASMLSDSTAIAKLARGLKQGEYAQIVARHIDPGIADQTPAALSPQAEEVAKAVNEFFSKYGKEVEALDIPLAKNAKSGSYYPRRYEGSAGIADDDMIRRLLERKQAATAEHGVAAGALKERTGDVAWGDVLGPGGVPTEKGAELASKLKGQTPELARDLATYGKQVSEAKGYHFLEKELARHYSDAEGKITPRAQEFLVKNYGAMQRVIEDRVDKLLMPDSTQSWTQQAGRLALQALDTFHRYFKVNNLVYRFPYHVTNVFGDGTLMAAHGVNPVAAVIEAVSLVKRAKKGDAEALSILQAAQKNKIGLRTSMARLETPGASRLAQEVNQLKQAGGEKLSAFDTAQAAIGKLPGAKALPAISDTWETYSKLGAYLDGIKQGMSPEQAAQRAFTMLNDYGSTTGQRGLTAAAQRAILFHNYLTQAAKSGALAALQSPSRFTAGAKVMRDLGDQDAQTAPSYMRENNVPLALPEGAKAAMSSLREATGGDPFVGDTFVNPKLGQYDALSLPLALAEGVSDVARGGLGAVPSATSRTARFLEPNLKFLYESATGVDTLTGAPKEPGSEVTTTPLLQVPERYAKEVLLPAMLPAPFQAGLNYGLSALGGDEVTIGRPRADSADPQNANFRRLAPQVSPWVPTEVGPTGEAYDQKDDPAAERYRQVLKFVNRRVKQRRALRQRQKQREG